MHFEQHTQLDNLIAMQNLRTSANKGSNDAYDVSVSLTLTDPLSSPSKKKIRQACQQSWEIREKRASTQELIQSWLSFFGAVGPGTWCCSFWTGAEVFGRQTV